MARLFIDAGVLSNLAQQILIAISFFLVVATWFFLKRSPGWLRSVRATNWPATQGRVESTHVEAFADQALGEIAYSYVVEGERFSGYFSRQFATEKDAWNYLTPLQGQSLFVRYDSAHPQVSAIRRSEQSPLFAQAQTSFVGSLVSWLFESVLGLHDWRELTVVGASSWPMSRGRIESEIVTHHRERFGVLSVTVHVAEVSYSYRVDGEYFSGHFERSFYRESPAQKFASQWKDRDVLIRHRRQTPEISVLLMKDQETLQKAVI